MLINKIFYIIVGFWALPVDDITPSSLTALSKMGSMSKCIIDIYIAYWLLQGSVLQVLSIDSCDIKLFTLCSAFHLNCI